MHELLNLKNIKIINKTIRQNMKEIESLRNSLPNKTEEYIKTNVKKSYIEKVVLDIERLEEENIELKKRLLAITKIIIRLKDENISDALHKKYIEG